MARKKKTAAKKTAVRSVSFDAPQSRNEAILQNILGANNVLEAPQSRNEAILQAILNGTSYTEEPQSRIEELLLCILNGTTTDMVAQSRNEEILVAKINGSSYDKAPQSRIEELLTQWAAIPGPYVKKYGVRWNKVDADCTERLWDAADITLDTTHFAYRGSVDPLYDNPFDSLYPFSQMRNCNVNLEAFRALSAGEDIRHAVTAWYGDDNYADDGTNGFVGAYRPAYWFTAIDEGDSVVFGVSTAPVDGWAYCPPYIRGYGFGVDDGQNGMTCYNGQPLSNITMQSQHQKATAGGFSIDNIFDYSAELTALVVEFATLNTQSAVGFGVDSLYRQNAADKPLIGETDAMRVVLPQAFASFATDGATLDFGASNGAVVLANRRTCKGYEAYPDDSGYVSVLLDAPLTTTVDMFASVHGMANGDSIGRSGYIGTNGRSTAYYRGAVVHANRFRYILGAYRNTGDEIWVAKDRAEAEAYDALNTGVHTNTGLILSETEGYIKTLGFISGLGAVPVCTEVGGNNANPVGDYLYKPSRTTAARVLVAGGAAAGGRYCGGFCGYWYTTADYSSWNYCSVPSLRNS